MKKIILLIKARFSSQSPEFFIKIRNWAFIIGLIAATVLALPISLPSWAVTLVTLLIGICTGLSGGSTITTNDKILIKETETLFPDKVEYKKRFSFFKPRKTKRKKQNN